MSQEAGAAANERDTEEASQVRCYVCGSPARSERVLVDVPAALRICKVGRSTLYRWMSEGLVEWAGLPDGSRGIFLDTLFRDRMRRPE